MTIRIEEIKYEGNGSHFAGACVYDDSRRGTRPGVLIAHSAMGLELSKHELGRAQALVKLGYAAFVADLYGDDGQPRDEKQAVEFAVRLTFTENLVISRIAPAVAAFRSHPLVDSAKIAAIGYCLGGTAVLCLARPGLMWLGGLISRRAAPGAHGYSDADKSQGFDPARLAGPVCKAGAGSSDRAGAYRGAGRLADSCLWIGRARVFEHRGERRYARHLLPRRHRRQIVACADEFPDGALR